MREILFRAKSIGTNEWVYGSYVPFSRGKTNAAFITVMGKDHISYISCHQEVLPETIGQFTGLYDTNGNKIFEGDITICSTYECEGKLK